MGRMRWIYGIISALMLTGGAVSPAAADVSAPVESTLFSGEFDGILRIAADHEGKRLSGYFDDGKCRFALGGALKPVLLYGRPDNGEAYEVEGWNPATPEKRFSIEVFSLARHGFQDLISMRFGGGDTSTTIKCSWRRTLDRANNMSSTFIAVRVIRKSHPHIYDLVKAGNPPLLKLNAKDWPAKGSAVWVTISYSEGYAPKGFVNINWYPAEGPPKGGYIREHDLYALPTEAQ
jgi:hypothetical protein